MKHLKTLIFTTLFFIASNANAYDEKDIERLLALSGYDSYLNIQFDGKRDCKNCDLSNVVLKDAMTDVGRKIQRRQGKTANFLASDTLFLVRVNFAGANFSNSTISGIVFSASTFSGANMKNVTASTYNSKSHGQYEAVNFTRATLAGAKNLSGNFKNVILDHSNLSGLSFCNIDLKGISFKSADLRSANFLGSIGIPKNIDMIHLNKTKMTEKTYNDFYYSINNTKARKHFENNKTNMNIVPNSTAKPC